MSRLVVAVAALALVTGCQAEVVTEGTPASAGCPAAAPEVGSACDHAGACGYAGPPCASFTCAGGVWQAASGGCKQPPTACPSKLPTAGAPCKSPGQACTFTFSGSCTVVDVATCSDGSQWAVTDQSPPCVPPATTCGAHATSSDCAADTACKWLVPGCGTPLAPLPAGCYSSAPCATDGDCATGMSCQMVEYDPCWGLKCQACGATTQVCL